MPKSLPEDRDTSTVTPTTSRLASGTSPAGWRERWRQGRDRLLASAAFQRWAADFPLTRPIARRRARQLFDVCAGFVYSQVLFACVRSHLLEILWESPKPLPVLAARLGMEVDAARCLLEAASALELVERRGAAHWGIGPQGAAMMGNPGIAAMVEHHALLYADLQDPLALLRGPRPQTALAGFWPYVGAGTPQGASAVASYSTLMATSQAMLAQDILDAYPVTRHRRMLDVGGGEGAFLAAAAARAPELALVLFDLPEVAERARQHFARLGLAGRAEALAGDFRRDPLPEGADLVSLVRVLHDHDDDQALRLLRAVYGALVPGGTVLVAEPMIDPRTPDPAVGAYFSFYLRAMGSGRPRRPSETIDLLQAAGFTGAEERRVRQPLLTRAIAARKPAA